MNFTAKEDYGLRAILDLALRTGGPPVQAREIAARQRIPEQFLEQLLSALRRAEVVRSTRGAAGGYSLVVDPSRLTVGTVLRALSGPFVPSELVTGCEDDPDVRELPETMVVRQLWGEFREALRSVADRTTIAELLERRNAADISYMMHI